MSHVAVLGAGLGGTIMAYELRDALGPEHKVSVVNKGSRYSFVPSNPWVAVGWRDREAVEIDLGPVFARRRIDLYPQGAKRLHPDQKRIELTDGSDVVYDYVVIATGPELAFDEIEGFGPAKETQSICFIDHALDCVAIPPVGKTPVPVGVPKSGFMIESMVTATAQNIASLVAGREPTAVPTWNAVCLGDFGDVGGPGSARRECRRATSTGHHPAPGYISPRSASRSTSCTRCDRASPSHSTRGSPCRCWVSRS